MNRVVRKIKQIIKGRPARNNLTVFNDDVFLVSYPRSGNTWVRFIIGSLIAGFEIDWKNLELGIPDIYRNTDKELLKIGRPRVIKSHHPYDEKYYKVIYLVRDVRDVIISYHNYHLKFKQRNYQIKSIDEFINEFINGNLDDFGNWAENVSSWIDNKDKVKNGFLLVKYEDLRKDTFNCIKNILSFINIDKSDDIINEAIKWSSFNNMKKMESVQKDADLFIKSNQKISFMRSGKSDDWKNILNNHQKEKINDYYGEILKNLEYEI